MRKFPALCMAAALILPGCVEVDNSLGEGLVDKSLLYDTYTVEVELDNIQMKMADALSGYSSSKLTVGAIRDDVLGLSTREAAFPLIPALDTIDLGSNPTPVSFTMRFSADSVSCNDDDNARILQNLRITALSAPLPVGASTSCTQDIPHGSTLLTKGIPVYNGTGDLSITFSLDYARQYIDALRTLGPALKERSADGKDDEKLLDKYDEWVAAVPGIHMAMDNPSSKGGRINLFNFPCLSVSNNYYTYNSTVALLKVHSTWEGVEKDSTFMFIPGETAFFDEGEYVRNNKKFDQFCFNRTTHETTPGAATDAILVEGGGGLKPVILASELQEKTRAAIARNGGNPDEVIIVKASIILPFEKPASWDELKYYPSVLSPTIQTVSKDEDDKEYISFAGLTDASVSTENQGNIDRSNLRYAPDITYHLQAIMDRNDLASSADSDIWLLTIHTEKVANANGSLYDNSYYQQLMYASYYESLYGGYGGYGGYGYGGYGGYGYNNYYNYMMLAQMMSASSQQTYSYNSELDKDRFYRAVLCGPESERKPVFRVTYAVQKAK